MDWRRAKLRTSVGLTMVIVFALLAMASPVARAGGNGISPASLSAHGWSCADVILLGGTDVGVHCFPPGPGNHDAAITVTYFATSDPQATSAAFLGTEILIRADLYAGQPCPTEGHPQYTDLQPLLGIPYFACHHPAGGP